MILTYFIQSTEKFSDKKANLQAKQPLEITDLKIELC